MDRDKLETGMVVQLRRGDKMLVTDEMIISPDYIFALINYNKDLTYSNGNKLIDIVRVFKPIFKFYDVLSGSNKETLFTKSLLDIPGVLIWERQAPIEWCKVPSGTTIIVQDKSYIEETRIFFGYCKGALNPIIAFDEVTERVEGYLEARIENPKAEWLENIDETITDK